MHDDDREFFYEAIRSAHDVIGKPIGAGALEIWFDVLADYELSDITFAITRHLRDPLSGQFAPKPADVIRNIEGRSDDAAMLAWAKVRKSIGSVGAWSSIAFDDPIIHAVLIDMGGWPKLCSIKTKEEPFIAKDFERRYCAFRSRRAIPSECPRYLTGLSDGNNSQVGYQIDPPVLVGDKEKATLVLEGSYEKALGGTFALAAELGKKLQLEQRKAAA